MTRFTLGLPLAAARCLRPWVTALAACLSMAAAAPTMAQTAQPNVANPQLAQNGRASATATTTTSQIALPGVGPTLKLANDGTSNVSAVLGTSSGVTAAVGQGYLIHPGEVRCISMGFNTNLALIAATGTDAVDVETGQGACQDHSQSGSGGGGGGAVTNAGTFAVQNTAATPAGTNVIGHVIVDAAPTTAITAAALPLPTGAMQQTGGTVGLVAGSANIGSVNAPISGLVGGSVVTLALPSTTSLYPAGSLMCTSPTVATCNTALASQFFTIANSAGGASIPLIKVSINDNISTGWGGQTINIDFWTAAPTFVTTGDRGVWTTDFSTGAANHLATFTCVLSAATTSGDGVYAECGPVVGAFSTFKLASGANVYWTATAVTGTPGVVTTNKTLSMTPWVWN